MENSCSELTQVNCKLRSSRSPRLNEGEEEPTSRRTQVSTSIHICESIEILFTDIEIQKKKKKGE